MLDGSTFDMQALLNSGVLSFQTPDLSLEPLLYKLGFALFLGLWTATLILWTHPKRKLGKRNRALVSMFQTHVFLCISGAFVMIIIGNSLANAFGLSGALNMIRFRTNLIDPKDAALIIVVISLGMACGLGLFIPAIIASIIASVLLVLMALHHEWSMRRFQAPEEDSTSTEA